MVLTLLLAFDPVRLGLVLLLISRPRPVQNLLTYWVGAMIVSVPYMLVPLTLLHVTPVFRSFAQHVADPATLTSPTVRHIQIGMGAFVLSAAALMAVRFWGRLAYLSAPGVAASALVPDSNTQIVVSRPSGSVQDAPTEGRSAIRRLRDRTRNAWKSGSRWFALMIGLASGPPPLTVLLVLTTIVASRAAIGEQIGAALAWVVGMFVVVEIILVSYVASPARTQSALQLVHDWSLTYRRQVVVAVLAVIGSILLAYGLG